MKLMAIACFLLLIPDPSRSAEKTNPNFQFSLGITSSKGIAGFGYQTGMNYYGIGLQGVGYAFESLFLAPGISYQRTFIPSHSPYFSIAYAPTLYFQGEGVTAQAIYKKLELKNGLNPGHFLPGIGYELFFRKVNVQFEGNASTPLNSEVFRDWTLGIGLGISFKTVK